MTTRERYSTKRMVLLVGIGAALLLTAQVLVAVVPPNIGKVLWLKASLAATPAHQEDLARQVLAVFAHVPKHALRADDFRAIAAAYRQTGEQARGIATLESALLLAPESALYFDLGTAQYATGDKAAAYAAWQTGGATAYFVKLGNRGLSEDERRHYYELALAVANGSSDPFYVFGDYLFYSTTDRARAIELYKQAVALETGNSGQKALVLGRIAAYESRWHDARSRYEDALRLGNQSANAYVEYGDTLGQLNARVDKILDAYESARQLEPYNKWPYLRIAHLYLKSGHPSLAKSWYEDVLAGLMAIDSPDNARTEKSRLIENLIEGHIAAKECELADWLLLQATTSGLIEGVKSANISGCD